MANIRQPAVAGQFYPATEEELRQQLESFPDKREESLVKKTAFGCMLPHAGYMYSGAVAKSVVSQIEIPGTLIILGPNHTGRGGLFSIMNEGSWMTPLGSVSIDSKLAKKLKEKSPLLKTDFAAHESEHSIEVELPLLQYYKKDFSFVPIVIASTDFKNYQRLGLSIAAALKELHADKDTLLIASSDMTHYEDAATAKVKDTKAIQAIVELDEVKLWEKVRELDITMCGYAPAIVMIVAAKALGATKAELVKYQTSGDVTGDNSSVVGYAGIIVHR